jgi:hypothetical protein
MFRRGFDFSWPFLCILVLLFILSIKSPRGWERFARPEPIREVASSRSLPTVTTLPAAADSSSTPVVAPNGFKPVEPAGRIASALPDVEVAVQRQPASPLPLPASTPGDGDLPSPAGLGEAVGAPMIEPPVAQVPAAEPAIPETPMIQPPASESVAEESPDLPMPAEEAPDVPDPALVARNVTSPSTVGPAVRPDTTARPEAMYPSTGFPPVGPTISGAAAGKSVISDDPNAEAVKPLPPCWQEPETLLARLDELAKHEATKKWATEASQLVRRLGLAVSARSEETPVILQRLGELSAEASVAAPAMRDRGVAQNLSRAGHALERRLDIWKQVAQAGLSAEVKQPPGDPQSMSLCLAEIDVLMRESPEGNAWRQYLQVDALREWITQRKSAEERLPRELANQVLARLSHTPMTQQQRSFVSRGPLAALQVELLHQMVEPVDAGRLLRHMERYEQSGLPSDARLLAEDCRNLAFARAADQKQLEQQIERHYRNANIRLAVSANLLNRLIPKREPELAPVHDTVLGLPVRGRSLTSSEVAVRLLPDPEHVRLALEVTGEVESLTSATSGPATLINDGEAVYIARKPLQVDLTGIRVWPAQVEVLNRTRLRELQTDFDGVPLFGPLVRVVARSQQEQQRPLADAEVREKIAAQAQARINRETSAQLRQAAQRLHQRVLGPVDALALEPTLIAAETTQQRFIMRVRLAGNDQLGSHTPRPQAPADSLASVQIHETAINNVMQRLELDGQTFTLPELERHVAARLNRPLPTESNPDRDDVKVTFADRDAIRVRCVDGRIEITLSVAKLSKPPRKWRDFQVRAYYRPEVNGRSAELVRDGVIQLIGRVNAGGQIALRGVFSRTFSRTAPWKLLPDEVAADPRLADLTVSQFVVDDGWVGMAMSPERTASQPAGPRR